MTNLNILRRSLASVKLECDVKGRCGEEDSNAGDDAGRESNGKGECRDMVR